MNIPLHSLIKEMHLTFVGRHRKELITPALILDLDIAKRNIDYMQNRMKKMPAELRPHIKVQKCAELADLQIKSGAIGVCTATAWEAIVMSRGGIKDVLIANQVAGKEKIDALAKTALAAKLTLTLDDKQNAKEISEAAIRAGSQFDFLIEIDVGQKRGGVRTIDEALELAQYASDLKGLRFRGMMGYEGHCMLEPDRALRIKKAGQAVEILFDAVQKLDKAGFKSDVVSAGGTGTYDITGNEEMVTEIQAGSYVFMDLFHGNLVPGFLRALTVSSTVAIKHGKTIVLDAGRKSIGIDFVLPEMVEYPFYKARYFAEEHALFDIDDRCLLKRGDKVELIPGYAPTTVNLHDVYYVVENDVVTDVWPIIPRGPGNYGLI